MNTMKDDHDFNINFVALIERYPCLYDYTSIDYSKKNVQEKTWELISKEMSGTVQDCKERWKNLRGCYTRHLKSLTVSKAKKPYYLAEYLNFLRPFTKTRRSRSGISTSHNQTIEFEHVQDEEDTFISDIEKEDVKQELIPRTHAVELSEDDGFSTSHQKKIKLKQNTKLTGSVKKSTLENSTVEPTLERRRDDPDMSFLTSVLPDMKEMNSVQKRRFKIGILSLAGQILNENNQFTS